MHLDGQVVLRRGDQVAIDGTTGSVTTEDVTLVEPVMSDEFRTVLRWAERAGLPAPRRMLAWMRILLAAVLLDDPGRTVLSVAHACGYSSDSSLRRAMLLLWPCKNRRQCCRSGPPLRWN